MTFRKEKGRHEVVTSDGKIIHFEDAAEMLAFAKLRNELNALLGRNESMEIDDSVKELFLPTVAGPTKSLEAKTVKVRTYKGEYIVDGLRLKKKKALA